MQSLDDVWNIVLMLAFSDFYWQMKERKSANLSSVTNRLSWCYLMNLQEENRRFYKSCNLCTNSEHNNFKQLK